MRKPWLSLSLMLLAAVAAHADGAPEQAAVAHVPAPTRLRQQLKAHGTEVAQLEQAVSTQESRSREAGQRLEEQNRRIAELRRQLEELSQSQQEASSGR
jgi:septal ring factor EnvC (AmiA/AmiB activator)